MPHISALPVQQPGMQGQWFSPGATGLPALSPQAPYPALPPPTQQTPSTPMWDDTYAALLGTQDTRQLHELLARLNPEVVMPLEGQSPLSQGVMILTLVHTVEAFLQLVINY